MKTKDAYIITEKILGKIFLDMPCSDGEWEPSELILFVKDTHYNNDSNNNKLSLIIIDKNNGYVVNNDFRFNSLEIENNKFTFYYMIEKERKETSYWIK